MTAKCVTSQQNNIDRQNNRANSDSEAIGKPKRVPNVMGKDHEKEERKIEKVTMHILHDERERPLAPVAVARLAYCACGRISPEGFVVRAAVVVAGQAKSGRRPKNNQCGRKDEPMRPPVRFQTTRRDACTITAAAVYRRGFTAIEFI